MLKLIKRFFIFWLMGILIGLSISQCAQADFDFLKTGQIVPYDGFLITPEREQKLRLVNETLKVNEAIIQQYGLIKTLDEKHIDILQQRLTIYQDENIRMSKEMVEARGDGFWNKFLYFALGAAATTAIAYGVSRATR